MHLKVEKNIKTHRPPVFAKKQCTKTRTLCHGAGLWVALSCVSCVELIDLCSQRKRSCWFQNLVLKCWKPIKSFLHHNQQWIELGWKTMPCCFLVQWISILLSWIVDIASDSAIGKDSLSRLNHWLTEQYIIMWVLCFSISDKYQTHEQGDFLGQ